MTKGAGTVTGAAYVGWDSTYAFNADGRRLPLEQIGFVQYPNAPLTGIAEAGIAIVILAIILDRITQRMARRAHAA